MNNFTYYTPTKVVFGRGSEGQTGALVRERGFGEMPKEGWLPTMVPGARACWTG